MSTEKQVSEMKMEEVTTEYQKVCMHAGDLQYRVAVMSRDLAACNLKLQELNQAAVKLMKDKDEPASGAV